MHLGPGKEEAHLEDLIPFIMNNTGGYLCIYDLSGIHYKNPMLHIPAACKFHNSEFCTFVKTTQKGLKYCLRCKHMSISRASSCDQTYLSECYMGVMEIVKPVFIHGRIASVIYFGNLYDKSKEAYIKEKMRRRAGILGLCRGRMEEKFETLLPVSGGEINKYIKAAELLHKSILLAYSYCEKNDLAQPARIKEKSHHWLVQTAVDFILANYHTDIRMEHIAGLHSVNPNYLRGIFKKECGMSFTEYLNTTRIESAESLLRYTGKSVIDISVQIGFHNVTYFNKIFKDVTGKTPTEYRKNLQNSYL